MAYAHITIEWMNLKKPRPLCENRCGERCKRSQGKYCSLKCMFDYDFKLRIRLVELGQYPVGPQCRMIKKYLIWKFGERCSRCGWAERHPKTGKVPVEVEHLDGNFENNNLSNVALLCPNCHSLTATYRGLNRGKGRAERLGGRKNPLRGDMPRHKRLIEPLTTFPLARSLVELVERKVPSPAE